MGTVKKIIDDLQRQCDDKKAQADRRFEDHSAWLNSEFVQIHRLLQGLNLEPESIVQEAPISKSQKRKSPETCQNGSRSSPLSKRTTPSPAFEDIAQDYGLPKDLNRLTKDQLLVELEKRGCATMTMKALKRDLIDTLKELVVDSASRENSPTELDQPEEQVEEAAEQLPPPVSFEPPAVMPAPVVDLATASPRDPARKGSNSKMAELRNRLVGNAAAAPPVADASKSVAATEFEARQRRHRKSQEIRNPPAEQPVQTGTPGIMPPPMSPAAKREPQSVSTPGSAQKLPFLPVQMPVLLSGASPAKPPVAEQAKEESDDDDDSRMEQTDEPEDQIESDVEEEPEAAPAVEEEQDGEAMEECEEPPVEEIEPDVVEEKEEAVDHVDGDADSENSFHSAGSPEADIAGEGEKGEEQQTSEVIAEEPEQQGDEEPTPAAEKEEEEEPEYSLEELSPALKEMPVLEATVQSSPLAESAPVEEEPIDAPVKTDEEPVVVEASVVAKVEPVSKSAPAATDSKKPSNLMSGSTSFFSNNTSSGASAAKPKPVVPALLRAQKLREKEEALQLAKKKELEEKKKANAAGPFSTSSATTSTAPGGKSFISGIFGAKQGASASSAKPAAASAVPPAPPQAKKGLFGWNGAAKKEIGGTSAPSTANPIHKASAIAAPAPDENAPPADVPGKTTTSSHPAPHPSTATSTIGILKEIPVTKAVVEEEVPPPPPVEKVEYIIEDREDSDSSDTDGEDDNAGGNKKAKQPIPEWAKGPQLKAALEKQYGFHGGVSVDPDSIFTEVHTCSLEEIFGKREGKCGKYSARTSSAHWEADKLSVVDKRKYRVQMGYDKA